jgi:16S rRNA (adenine1518-N6/adenine1519-N6)-dimethyltransferase
MIEAADEGSFQTQARLRELLGSAGLHPRKRFGQHFLIDRNLMRKLIEAAELSRRDVVLEVGVGTGSLTSLIAAKAGRVLGVEIDTKLFPLATQELAKWDNVELLQADALLTKSTVNPLLEQRLTALRDEIGGPMKLVANLPYDIATSLIMDLLIGAMEFERYCFTVQSEVADRFLAEPGGKNYGPVSVMTTALTTARRICRVPPQAFWPAPKVDSTMLHITPRQTGTLSIQKRKDFSRFVRAFFQHRRQTIGHIARRLPDNSQVFAAIESVGIDAGLRPEALAAREWLALHSASY